MFIENIKSEIMTLPNFNQLSTSISDNLYKNNINNNNDSNLVNIPYHNDNMKATILTPTSPNTNPHHHNNNNNADCVIKDSPFFVPPPFQPFSYSTSPNQTHHNSCQISPLKSVGDNNYDNDAKSFTYNYCDLITSIADTPDSIFDSNKYNYNSTPHITSDTTMSVTNDSPHSNIFFKFDPEVIERYNYQQQMQQQQPEALTGEQQQQIQEHFPNTGQQSLGHQQVSCNEYNNIINLDRDYFNFNEINCQSKNQSPCSSPSIDPWITYTTTIPASNGTTATITTLEKCDYSNCDSKNSPKHNNDANCMMSLAEQQQQIQKLPPIETVFSSQSQYMNTIANDDCDNTFNDCCFDTTFLDQFNTSSSASNDTNLMSDAYLHSMDNYNLQIDNKPNREYKDIWCQNAAEEQDDGEDEDNDDALFVLKTNGLKSELEAEPQEPVVLECLWTDCNLIFPTQSVLVSHIEKNHIELRKGEEFACFWLGCVRRYRPFNARYKLLVHMRVHTLEKPNKCPVSISEMQLFILFSPSCPFLCTKLALINIICLFYA